MKRTPLKSNPDKIRAWKQRSAKPLKRSRIKPVSAKRQSEGKEYSVLRKKFLTDHPTCQAGNCTAPATQLHHTAGRGRNYLRVSTFMAVCFDHHSFTHENPREAEKLGWLKPNRNSGIAS